MKKLVILSERNILNYLKGLDIRPYSFYTDFNLFKTKSQYLMNSVVLVIFSGACNFSVKQVCDCIKDLKARANKVADNGVLDVVTISDFKISSLNDYYIFDSDITQLTRYNGKELYISKDSTIMQHLKIKPEHVNLLDRLDYDKSDEVKEIFLDIDSYKVAINNYKENSGKDESLRRVIKIPSWKYVQ